MNPEIESLVKEEIKKFEDYLFWRLRDIAGEFPNKIRIDVFFPRNEGKNSHYIEVESTVTMEKIKEYELRFQEWEKEELVKVASGFLKGKTE